MSIMRLNQQQEKDDCIKSKEAEIHLQYLYKKLERNKADFWNKKTETDTKNPLYEDNLSKSFFKMEVRKAQIKSF